MIRNMRGTIFAVNAGASGVPRGQQQNSPVRNGGLRSRERRFKSCRGRQIRQPQARIAMAASPWATGNCVLLPRAGIEPARPEKHGG
jgi:hypothetical protein